VNSVRLEASLKDALEASRRLDAPGSGVPDVGGNAYGFSYAVTIELAQPAEYRAPWQGFLMTASEKPLRLSWAPC